MEFGACLKSFIYLISASLFYPVLLLLSSGALWIVLSAGAVFAEWLERVRLPRIAAEKLPAIIATGPDPATLPHRVRTYIQRLTAVIEEKKHTEPAIEILIQDTTLSFWKSTDRLRMAVRIAPSLGLIGTLIPMGTGLAALGQGDMTRLSSDLVIAFTTTVVGLAVGITAFFLHTVKLRWIEEDIRNIELATDILIGEAGEP